MNNKRIIIVFCALVAVVALIVISGALFVVQQAEVEITNRNTKLDASDILDELQYFKGSNVIVLSKKQVASRIEKTFPYAEVVGIERIFPSKIKIYVSERYEQYDVARGTDFIHVASDGRILSVDSVRNPNNITVSANYFDIGQPVVGDYLFSQNARVTEMLTEICSASEFDEYKLSSFIESVDFAVLDSLCVVKTKAGCEFNLRSFEGYESLYAEHLFFIYNQRLDELERSKATVNIYRDQQGQIRASVIN